MRPLEGIKVVDLTTYLAAPTTVRVLGEWGADCVKIESAKGFILYSSVSVRSRSLPDRYKGKQGPRSK